MALLEVLRKAASTGIAGPVKRRRGTRPRVCVAALVGGIALGLALSGVTFACQPTPVNCGPIVFRPTGRPLELEIWE